MCYNSTLSVVLALMVFTYGTQLAPQEPCPLWDYATIAGGKEHHLCGTTTWLQWTAGNSTQPVTACNGRGSSNWVRERCARGLVQQEGGSAVAQEGYQHGELEVELQEEATAVAPARPAAAEQQQSQHDR